MTSPLAVSWVYLSCGLFLFFLGLAILRAGRAGAATRAAAMMLFFGGLGPLLSASGRLAGIDASSRAYRDVLESFEYLWEFFFPSLALFALAYPRESRLLRRAPVAAFLLFVPYIAHLGIMMYGDRLLDAIASAGRALPETRPPNEPGAGVGDIDNVLGVSLRVLERVHRSAFAMVDTVYALAAVTLLWVRRTRSPTPRVARQIRTVAAGCALSLALYVAGRLAPHVSDTSWARAAVLINASLLIGAGVIADAVLRRQFLGVRDVVRRTLLYAVVAAGLGAVYVLVVMPTVEYFGRFGGTARDVFEAGFVVLAVITLQPALQRFEQSVARAFLGARGDLEARLGELASRLADVDTREELERNVADALREVVDAPDARLVVANGPGPVRDFVGWLGRLGEPVRRIDIERMARPPKRSRLMGALRRTDRAQAPSVPAPPESEADAFVPVVRGGECVGYVALAPREYGVPYGAREVGRLGMLSPQLGAALERIDLVGERVARRVLEQELALARRIQTRLLPGEPPRVRGWEFAAAGATSRHVGGDYYDWVPVDETHVGLLVADVSGKGMPAAILTASLQAAVHSNTDAVRDPAALLRRLNRLLWRNTSPSEFATVFYAVIDAESGRVVYASAGHEFARIVTGAGVRRLDHSDLVLGCLEDYAYSNAEANIPPGGALVAFTDGITDAGPDDDPFGEGRLDAVLAEHAEADADTLCRAIFERARAHNGVGEAQDDYTVAVAVRTASGAGALEARERARRASPAGPRVSSG